MLVLIHAKNVLDLPGIRPRSPAEDEQVIDQFELPASSA
jgi:hypothetical protein